MAIKLSEIKNKKLRAFIKSELARIGYSKPKRNRKGALVRMSQAAPGLVDIDCPLLVRIKRRFDGKVSRRYDDDNFVAGCKPLRDAIAAALSRRGDSEKDGLWWEYQQEIGEPEIKIEVFLHE